VGGPTGSSLARTLREHAAFFAGHGVWLERVLTGNAKAYTDAVVFTDTAAGLASASSTPALPATDQWRCRTRQPPSAE
jgi:hypothetical protein